MIRTIFGKTIKCTCGKTHQIEPQEILYCDDAIDLLPKICSRYAEGKSILVLMDNRTLEAAGAEAIGVLKSAGWVVCEHILPDSEAGGSPVCDLQTRRSLDGLTGLGEKASLILAVGAGTVNDLAKWLAFDEGKPYLVLATVASMNGYASPNVAPSIDGVKTLIRAQPPRAVLTSGKILTAAPYRLTAAGLGDVLAKSVSSADWYLNHLLFGDYYCAESVGLIAEIEPLYMDQPQQVRDSNPEAIKALFNALLLTGAAMTMAETSAPASGGEHLISHTLDMISNRDGTAHDLHGRQVGVGTILSSEIYQRVLAIESPDFVAPAVDIDRKFWAGLSDEVASQYAEKVPRLQAARDELSKPGRWDQLRQELAPLPRASAEIAGCLCAAGAACRASDIGCTIGHLKAVLIHAHEMRSRFTILDLARLVGVMDHAADEIIDCWG